MQIFIHCKTTLHVSGVTAPTIRSIKNCTLSLRYRSYYLYRYSPPTWSDWDGVLYRRLRVQFLILLMMGAMTPETCRVVLQWINICILLHLLDFYSHWVTMHGTTSLEKRIKSTLHEDQYRLHIISRSFLHRMRNVSDESCRENQNTFCSIFFFSQKSYFLCDNVEIYCRAGQATNENIAHAHCMLNT